MQRLFTYMLVNSRAAIKSTGYIAHKRALSLVADSDQIKKFKVLHSSTALVQLKQFSIGNPVLNKMVDPKRVLSYEDMLKVIHQPEKVIIDVRNPDEVDETGKIPSMHNVQDALTGMSNEQFKQQFQRNKPSSSDEIIFYCRSGRRSTEALDKALKLGYANSKTYLGSWDDWSSKHK